LIENRTLTRWLKPAAFQRSATGSYGTMPVNAILGPGRWNVDMGLSRAFRLVDQQVQFRMETFDVFNTMPTNNPVSALSSSVSDGQRRSRPERRHAFMQFAMKYLF
jgi:hypothetical protein